MLKLFMLQIAWLARAVSADQREIFVRSNEVFRAEMDGVFMGLGRYQRYRRVVADRIQEEPLKIPN